MYTSCKENKHYERLLAFLIIAFGIALRLGGYFVHRSLWGDEIALALNLRLRGFIGLTHTLDFEQTMPIPLLLFNKLVVTVFGPSEYAFRIAALLVGCCMIFVFWIVFQRLFGNRVALVAVTMAVICRPLIYYSSELKQYEVDALITVVSLWLIFQTLKDEKHWPRLLVWGVLALLLSQPAVFLLSTAGLIALIDARFRTSLVWRRYTIAAGAVWAGTFAGLYFLSYRAVSHSAYMRAFWSYSFLYPGSSGFRKQLEDSIYTLLVAQSFDHVRAILLFALFAVGLYGIWRSHGSKATLIAVLPFAEVLAAAALKQYPIAMRLVLFILPLTFWVYATGLVTISDVFRPSLRPAASFVLALALLGPATIGAIRYVLHFPQRETSQRMVSYMKAIDSTAPVYIAFDKYLQWAYYGEDWHNREELKQRLKIAVHSERRLEFLPQPGEKNPIEIVGQMPPAPTTDAADWQWARDEAVSIVEVRQPHAWLFAPVYNSDPVMGNFQQRKLLEKLQAELSRGGARMVQRYAKGDSTVFLYELPQRHASNSQRPERPFR